MFFFCDLFGDLSYLHSFPTRRSSDLFSWRSLWLRAFNRKARAKNSQSAQRTPRSEEHTSELQSLRHLVCRLLLEKKKQQARLATLTFPISCTANEFRLPAAAAMTFAT